MRFGRSANLGTALQSDAELSQIRRLVVVSRQRVAQILLEYSRLPY